MSEFDRSATVAATQAGVAQARFNELALVLEDLLKRIADTEDPHIRRLRAKVRAELLAIQSEVFGIGVEADQYRDQMNR